MQRAAVLALQAVVGAAAVAILMVPVLLAGKVIQILAVRRPKLGTALVLAVGVSVAAGPRSLGSPSEVALRLGLSWVSFAADLFVTPGGNGLEHCYSDRPAALRWAEAYAARRTFGDCTNPPPQLIVTEFESSDLSCTTLEEYFRRGEPIVVRHALEEARRAEFASAVSRLDADTNVTYFGRNNMTQEQLDSEVDCPHFSKVRRETGSLRDVLQDAEHREYLSFAAELFEADQGFRELAVSTMAASALCGHKWTQGMVTFMGNASDEIPQMLVHGTNLHADFPDNWYVQVSGTRTWSLAAPTWTPYLKAVPKENRWWHFVVPRSTGVFRVVQKFLNWDGYLAKQFVKVLSGRTVGADKAAFYGGRQKS